MSTNPIFGAQLRSPIAGPDGRVSWEWMKKFQEWEVKLAAGLTLLGEIAANARIQGRAEGIGTTVQNLNPTGDLLAGGVGFDADNVPDGVARGITTFNQRTGGGRGFNALDVNDRLVDSFRLNPVDATYSPSSGLGLTQSGVSTTINIAAGSIRFGTSAVAYNSGSVDPGALGTYFIYVDDPTFTGGAVTYVATATFNDILAAEGRLYLGKITTVGGGGGSGGGGGGVGGGGGAMLQ